MDTGTGHCLCTFFVFVVDPKSDSFYPKSDQTDPGLGQGHLEMESNFASYGFQRPRHLRHFGQKNVSLKLSDTRSFDGNPRGISAHFSGREIPSPLTVKLAICFPHGAETPRFLVRRDVNSIEIPLRLPPKNPTSET